jgi:hypothetical protein
MEICGDVMDDFYPTIFAHYPDSMAQCLQTAEASTNDKPETKTKTVLKENNNGNST